MSEKTTGFPLVIKRHEPIEPTPEESDAGFVDGIRYFGLARGKPFVVESWAQRLDLGDGAVVSTRQFTFPNGNPASPVSIDAIYRYGLRRHNESVIEDLNL